MSHRVIAPLVLVKVPGVGGDYRVDYHYQGSIIPHLTDEQRERFIEEGFVEELAKGEEPPAEQGPPKKTATQSEWATYAVSRGANPEEANGLTRQELVELYGG